MNNTENKITYSEKAFNDGYDFSSLTKREQILSQQLYISEEILADFYLSNLTIDKICNEELDFDINFNWGFAYSGKYYGYILNCHKIKKLGCSPYYLIRLLISKTEAKFIKFTTSFSDPVYKEIRRVFGFHYPKTNPFDYSNLELLPVCFSIENITTSKGNPFSVIKNMHILDDEEITTIYKMTNLMINQKLCL